MNGHRRGPFFRGSFLSFSFSLSLIFFCLSSCFVSPSDAFVFLVCLSYFFASGDIVVAMGIDEVYRNCYNSCYKRRSHGDDNDMMVIIKNKANSNGNSGDDREIMLIMMIRNNNPDND